MKRVRWFVGAGGALVTSGLLLGFLASGFGPVPALGRALDPGQGVWTSAADATSAHSEELRLPGLHSSVTVQFTSSGIASIHAGSNADLFEALGYVHARLRLEQMDLQRRLGAGRLAQLVGSAGVSSDKTELQLGLRRTAETQWAMTPRDSAAGIALTAYARGVNEWISRDRAGHRWPALFSLTGVYPAPWTPVDSLTVQEVLTENLSFSTMALDYAVLQRSLGPSRVQQWFPVLSPSTQRPYDPGPYGKAATAPAAPVQANVNADASPNRVTGNGDAPQQATHAAAAADRAVLGQISALAVTHRYRDSNAWAANGYLAHGRSILAGDPHLQHTLPAYWFEVALQSPGYAVTGFTLPGLPGVVIGRNSHISWSLTNVQNQSTLFYRERTDPRHKGEYYWRGAWRSMKRLRYQIPVRQGTPVDFSVDLTAHGPVLTEVGQTTSVYWTGDIPSPDLDAILAVDRSSDYSQFKSALVNWYAPAQNFVYADDKGNIGAIAAGYYPIVRAGQPWLPLSGTGESDVIGAIPYSAVPQVYNPPDHMVVSANDRPVAPDYPYYLGTSVGFDYGYRAQRIRAYLASHPSMTISEQTALQRDVTDGLAGQIVPRLLDALRNDHLSPAEEAARAQLAAWDDSMTAASPGASVWWTFWSDYLRAVFQPWWDAAKVPVHLDSGGLAVSATQSSLVEDLEAWTMRDQANPAFTPPSGPARTAPEVMRSAFHKAIADLTRTLGSSPATWAWGRLHRQQFPSLTQAYGLGYGPIPAGGDPWTVNAADDGMDSDYGPSLRMVVDWTGDSQAASAGMYPGGQSDNPGSRWYENLLSGWLAGRYSPLPPVTLADSAPIVWTLRAGR